MPSTPSIRPQAFLTLLLVAAAFAANHVAARVAFDHGADVATAVAVRSVGTAAVVALVAWQARVAWRLAAGQRQAMALIGLLLAGQSLCLYGAVARLPVGLALLAFNLYPLLTAWWSFVLYRERPPRQVLWAMPVILIGLALALDVAGAAAGLPLRQQWARIGAGVALAVAAAALFGLALTLTQHRVAGVDGRVRTALSMATVGLVALGVVLAQGGAHWPRDAVGWGALAALAVFYGSAFTVTFTLLPRLGVVGSSPILSVEPVMALLLSWLLLGQGLAGMQWLGAVLVVGTVMALGLRHAR